MTKNVRKKYIETREPFQVGDLMFKIVDFSPVLAGVVRMVCYSTINSVGGNMNNSVFIYPHDYLHYNPLGISGHYPRIRHSEKKLRLIEKVLTKESRDYGVQFTLSKLPSLLDDAPWTEVIVIFKVSVLKSELLT